jgi:hypothetical protein
MGIQKDFDKLGGEHSQILLEDLGPVGFIELGPVTIDA